MIGCAPGKLGCGSPVVGRTLLQKIGDPHEIVGEDRRSYQNLEPLSAPGQTPFHAAAAEEHRDAAFDTGAEFLTPFEGTTTFQFFLFRSLLATPLRYAYLTYSGRLTFLHILTAVEAPVGCIVLGCVSEGLLVTIQGTLDMVAIDRVPGQHPIVADQATSTLGQEDFMPKFYRLQSLSPFDEIGMGFEKGVDFLIGGNPLSLQHPAACLVDDPTTKFAERADLLGIVGRSPRR